MKKPFQVKRREVLRLRKAGFNQQDRRFLLTASESTRKEAIAKLIEALKHETYTAQIEKQVKLLEELKAKEAILVLNERYQSGTKWGSQYPLFKNALKKLTGKSPAHWKYSDLKKYMEWQKYLESQA